MRQPTFSDRYTDHVSSFGSSSCKNWSGPGFKSEISRSLAEKSKHAPKWEKFPMYQENTN